MKDPIVEEIHKFREKFAAKFGNDMHAMGNHLRKQQQKRKTRVVALAPKKLALKIV
jgi:hypothetical protein